MDAALLAFKEGVRSLGKKKLADGNEYELFYSARTPDELASFLGAMSDLEKIEKVADRLKAGQHRRAAFLAEAMCNADGTSLLTLQQALRIPGTLKGELVDLVVVGSNSFSDEAGKD